MEHKANIFGVALICVAFGSEALTLGRVRGAALVGQPLDMSVQVQMDPGEDASSLCFDADVFHADTRQESSRVRVVVEATAQPHTANVRVLSSAVIDEPVVTVYLRTGCGQKTTRRYVLLAELPGSVAASSLPPVTSIAALPPVQGVLPPVAAGSGGASPVASSSAPTVKAKAVPVPAQTGRREVANKRPDVKALVVSPRPVKSDEKKQTGRLPGQSRLKLDPLELLSDRVANIDSYMTFAPSEDALRNLQKVQALEGDVKALRVLSAKNEASLVDLRTRLQQAESDRTPAGLIYGLIALVLACLSALALVWNRQRRVHAGGDNWWSGALAMPAATPPEPEPAPAPGPLAAPGELDAGGVSKKPRSVDLSGLLNESGPSSELGVGLMEMSESGFDDLMQSGAAHPANRKLPSPPAPAEPPPAAPVHSLNSEAMLDIRQQAEFFVSLGQTDRAVRILRKQIHESEVANPLVYLDLLSLFHSLGLKNDFQLLRQDFNLIFSGKVPEFAMFKNEGKGLESYPDVLARITALWSTSGALAVIDTCIFRDPRVAMMPSFDLTAFRELLLLHDVAQWVILDADPENSGQTDFSANETLSPPMLDIDLDLDLSDSDIEGHASRPLVTAEVDIPLLMPGDHETQGWDAKARRSPDIDTMMKFELPETIKPGEPVGTQRKRPAAL